MKVSSEDLLDMGIADGIINEPLGGAHNNYAEMSNIIKNIIIKEINILLELSTEELINKRIDKYNQIGVFDNNE